MRNAPAYMATKIKIKPARTTPAVTTIRRSPRVLPAYASSRPCDSVRFMTGDYPA
jgi:hypothetical protein